MNRPELNEDVKNVIKSFIPDIERWISLRKIYNDLVLKDGLKKKTVAQLTLIQTNLIKMVETGGEFHGLRILFRSCGVDIEELKTRKRICYTTLHRWKNIRGKKNEKIEKIIKFVQRIGIIIRGIPIHVFSHDVLFRKLIIVKRHLRLDKQDIWAPKALKVLLLLISILKNPKKKRSNSQIS